MNLNSLINHIGTMGTGLSLCIFRKKTWGPALQFTLKNIKFKTPSFADFDNGIKTIPPKIMT